jgi:hypothetical protein
MLTSILGKDSLNDRHQTIVANIHEYSLVHMKEIRPHIDSRNLSVDNLQKIQVC